MTDPSIAKKRELTASFYFHQIHPNVRFGTASDRYAGWIGQIYPEHYRRDVSSRKRTLGGQRFEEQTLPIASVHEYFDHFNVLELDFTFYRPLQESKGGPSPNYFVLQQYAVNAPGNALFFLKVPQMFFARTLRRSKGGKTLYEKNPQFLNAEAYIDQFHRPALEILGNRLGGFIFEQEYQRVSESPAPEENVFELNGFFKAIPNDVQSHIELRSEHLLIPPYFDWLESRGIGFVFSHWTWLPPLRKQWNMSTGRLTAADGNIITRLLTPLHIKYADAYAKTHPFDKPVAVIAETRQALDMIADVTALIYQAEKQDKMLNVIANNRAWGNAPSLVQSIVRRLLLEEEKRGT